MTPKERKNKIEDSPLFPFTTPEGYFDSFKDRLMARIAEEEEFIEEPKKREVLQSLLPYLYTAAAVVGLILGLNFFVPSINLFENKEMAKTEAIELRAIDMSNEQFEEFMLDDTTDDYWGTVLLNDIDHDKNITSSR